MTDPCSVITFPIVLHNTSDAKVCARSVAEEQRGLEGRHKWRKKKKRQNERLWGV